MTTILMIQMFIIALYVFLSVESDRYPYSLTFVRKNFHLISAIFDLIMFICLGGYILIW